MLPVRLWACVPECLCGCARVSVCPVPVWALNLCACVPVRLPRGPSRFVRVCDLFICRARRCVVRASACGACVCVGHARVCVWEQRCQLRIASHVASACDATRTFRISPCGEHRFRFRARRRCFCKATCVELGSSRCGGTLVTPGGGSIIFGGAMRSPCGGCGAGGPESAG